jgi:hypothetical protein
MSIVLIVLKHVYLATLHFVHSEDRRFSRTKCSRKVLERSSASQSKSLNLNRKLEGKRVQVSPSDFCRHDSLFLVVASSRREFKIPEYLPQLGFRRIYFVLGFREKQHLSKSALITLISRTNSAVVFRRNKNKLLENLVSS